MTPVAGRRVLLIATTTGYQTRMFGEGAQRLGVELVFATDRCDQLDDPWSDGAVPIRFHEEERSIEAIVRSVAGRPVDGVLALGDRPGVLAARVAEALALPGHPPAAARAAHDKRLSRQRFAEAGLVVPWTTTLPTDAEPESLAWRLSYPLVVKPTALSGSRGVMRADTPGEFVEAVARLRQLLASPDLREARDEATTVIHVEGFIPGVEYAVEGVLEHGMLQVLAIFDKPDPLDGPFFEETIYVTPSRAPQATQVAIVEAIRTAAAALGLRHGPVHGECRVHGDTVFVLEVAARPIGGLCARALTFDGPGPAQQAGLEELLLRQAAGETVRGWTREGPASGVMMIPIPKAGIYKGVSGIDDASRVAGIDEIAMTAKPGQTLVPLPEGASYLGFIFARADTPEAAEDALRRAHTMLTFDVTPQIPVRPV